MITFTGSRWGRPESTSLEMTTDMMYLSVGPGSGKVRFVTTALVLMFLIDVLCAFGASRSGESYPALKEFMLLEDPGSELSFEEILSGDAPFVPQPDSVFRFGSIDHPVWLKAKLPILERDGGRPVLSLDSPVIRNATLYLPVYRNGGIEYRRLEGGLSPNLPPEDWRYRYMIYDLPDDIGEGEWIYLRFDTGGLSANFRLTLSDPAALRLAGWRMMIYLFFGMGILGGMILYNSIQFLYTRDRSFLFYVLYVSGILLYQFCMSGSGRIAGVPEMMGLSMPLACFSSICALIFAHYSLNLGKTAPRGKLFCSSLVLVSAAALTLWFSGLTAAANQAIHTLRVLLPLSLVFVSLLRIRQGYLPARYYLAAWTIQGVFQSILVLAGMGVLPHSRVSSNAHVAGAVVEAVLLSMALGDRARALSREKRRMQEEELRYAELSITDELTGLYNKKGYDSKSAMLYDWAVKNGMNLSLLVLGVDRFRAFNDSHGHAEGDRALQALARTIRNCIRDRDVACCFGGRGLP